MQKTKKIPLRKCVSCNERREKKDLVRIVASENGAVIDTTQKLNGRGAYLCRDEKCIANAQKRKALDRAIQINVSDDFYELLKKELQN